jgi:glycosyltransferase involved in cell wall biosynthesis
MLSDNRAIRTAIVEPMPVRTQSRLRVLVDGRELTGMGRYSGLGSFTRNLLGALGRAGSLQIRVLTTDPRAVPAGVEPLKMWRRFDERRRSIYEHEALISLDVLRSAGDVVYSPVLSGVPFTRRPYVQTLHDVIPLVLPDPDMAQLRRWWSRWARAYRKADAVMAVSRYTANEGIRLLALDPDRVHVAHNGVGEEFTPGSGAPEDPPYILLVSEYSARKGFADAFTVIGALADAGYPHFLKIAGRIQHQFRVEVEHLVRNSARPDRIQVLGFVEDLPALYRGATAFLSCSRYEGYGLPLVEAMACGVPVAAYANSSLPEVVGDAGVLVPDGDADAMIAAMRSLLDDRGRSDELREAGLERARQLTWNACAAAYREVFAEVVRR